MGQYHPSPAQGVVKTVDADPGLTFFPGECEPCQEDGGTEVCLIEAEGFQGGAAEIPDHGFDFLRVVSGTVCVQPAVEFVPQPFTDGPFRVTQGGMEEQGQGAGGFHSAGMIVVKHLQSQFQV